MKSDEGLCTALRAGTIIAISATIIAATIVVVIMVNHRIEDCNEGAEIDLISVVGNVFGPSHTPIVICH